MTLLRVTVCATLIQFATCIETGNDTKMRCTLATSLEQSVVNRIASRLANMSNESFKVLSFTPNRGLIRLAEDARKLSRKDNRLEVFISFLNETSANILHGIEEEHNISQIQVNALDLKIVSRIMVTVLLFRI